MQPQQPLKPVGASPRVTKRRAETRANLIEAAYRVFADKGFGQVRIDDVCAAAGYTRGAFYSNFGSKNELFIELLHDRVYTRYTEMTQEGLRGRPPTLRETGEILAAIQARPEGRWIWRLWFECLAQAGRDDELRQLAATFWQGNRERTAKLIEIALPHQKDRAKAIATALIALDIGLAIQHFVDPEDALLDLDPELYVLLFSQLSQQPEPPG